MFDIFSKEGIMSFLLLLPGLLIALSVHEFAHAYAAYKLGDRSQKALGRLTLNPFTHMDWVGFISLALLGIGWGKPVMVDDSNFKNKAKGSMLVALAGPLSNIILALGFTILLKILLMLNVFSVESITMQTGAVYIIYKMISFAISLNVLLAVFNMLPLPPFDGSKVLSYFLPNRFKGIMYAIEKYSFIILIVLLFTGIASFIVVPIQSGILWLLNLIIML